MTGAPDSHLLHELETRSEADAEQLLPVVYAELRGIAASFLRRERNDHTLQPTALVHEAYMRLANSAGEDRATGEVARRRFVALAARSMRQILVDHARRRGRDKRGGELNRVSLHESLPLAGADATEMLDLEAALQELEQRSERVAQIAELRLFGGLTFEEVAATLDTSPTTVKRDWLLAQAMLARTLAKR